MKFRGSSESSAAIGGTTIESNPKIADLAWPGAHKRLGCLYDHREQVRVIEFG
jgi:hypothetical protein